MCSCVCSFGGIGIGNDSVDILVDKIKYDNRRAYERWKKTDVLIIDESKVLSFCYIKRHPF